MAAQLEADPVDARVVKALGHPTRVRILNVLRDRELASPVELSMELGVPLGTIGYHVRRLELLGFIELARRTQRRGAIEHHYRARQLLDDERAHAKAPPAAPRGRGGRAGEALDVARAAEGALARGGFDGMVAGTDRRLLTLDIRGRDELERELLAWEATVERIVRACAARVAREVDAPVRRGVAVVMRFGAPAAVRED